MFCVNNNAVHFKKFNNNNNSHLTALAFVRDYQKGKTNVDLLEQKIVSGSGISWATCKFAHCSRQITMPVLHHSVFLQAGCPSCHPTNSIRALKATISSYSFK